MDNTRDKDVERGVRRIIGESLIQLRRSQNVTASDFCSRLGLTTAQYAELEQGQKIMNLPRYLQSLATLGAWVEIHTAAGFTLDTRSIYDVPGMRAEQVERLERTRQQSTERQRRHDEAVRWLEAHTPDNQKSE